MIGQSLFHAFDPNDQVFRANLVVWKGLLVAVAALRREDPALALAMSPFEAFARERPKEECFELVRDREFPECPSRLGCLFLFLTSEAAERCNLKWFNGARIVLEALIVPGANVGIFDAQQLETPPEQWEPAARRYWTGERTPDPHLEVLVDGKVQLVGWEPYARLGPA